MPAACRQHRCRPSSASADRKAGNGSCRPCSPQGPTAVLGKRQRPEIDHAAVTVSVPFVYEVADLAVRVCGCCERCRRLLTGAHDVPDEWRVLCGRCRHDAAIRGGGIERSGMDRDESECVIRARRRRELAPDLSLDTVVVVSARPGSRGRELLCAGRVGVEEPVHPRVPRQAALDTICRDGVVAVDLEQSVAPTCKQRVPSSTGENSRARMRVPLFQNG